MGNNEPKSRVITEDFFDDIILRVQIGRKEDFYDRLFDETVSKLVRPIFYGMLKYNEVEDAIQDFKIDIVKSIYEFLSSSKCNSKEHLEAWIVKRAKWACLNIIKKKQSIDLEYKDVISGKEIDFFYEGIDKEKINEYIEFIWNIDTEALKNIFFILVNLLDPCEADLSIPEDLHFQLTGKSQKIAFRYANELISPVSDNKNYFEDIILNKLYTEKTIFSETVIDFDDFLQSNGFDKQKRVWFRKIVDKLNEKNGNIHFGQKSVIQAIVDSKLTGDYSIETKDLDEIEIDKDMILMMSDYIAKGNNRVRSALKTIAPNEYRK